MDGHLQKGQNGQAKLVACRDLSHHIVSPLLEDSGGLNMLPPPLPPSQQMRYVPITVLAILITCNCSCIVTITLILLLLIIPFSVCYSILLLTVRTWLISNGLSCYNIRTFNTYDTLVRSPQHKPVSIK